MRAPIKSVVLSPYIVPPLITTGIGVAFLPPPPPPGCPITLPAMKSNMPPLLTNTVRLVELALPKAPPVPAVAADLLAATVPLLTTTLPVKVFAPESVSVPAPL